MPEINKQELFELHRFGINLLCELKSPRYGSELNELPKMVLRSADLGRMVRDGFIAIATIDEHGRMKQKVSSREVEQIVRTGSWWREPEDTIAIWITDTGDQLRSNYLQRLRDITLDKKAITILNTLYEMSDESFEDWFPANSIAVSMEHPEQGEVYDKTSVEPILRRLKKIGFIETCKRGNRLSGSGIRHVEQAT